jgi:apolipoprotein N-acyltransferase
MGKHRRIVQRSQPVPVAEDATATADGGAVTDSGTEPAAAMEASPPEDEKHDVDEDAHDAPSEPPAAANPTLADRVRAAAVRIWAAMLGALVPRLPRLVVTVAAGWLLFASFPTTNWWWAAVVAFALLFWVLTRPATTPAGGAGYGFLFGLTFYVALLPWISLLVGAVPWLALATVSALFPALFGLLAVVVRRLPGSPLWFAVLWAAQEWLKSSAPFGGFPWGSVAYGQASGPFLPLVQLGGVPLLSTAVVLLGCSFAAIAMEIVQWFKSGGQLPGLSSSQAPKAAEAPEARVGPRPPAVVLPGICVCLVLLAAMLVWPGVRRAGNGSGDEPTVAVAVVQGNVPRLGLDFNAQRRAVLDNHVEETLRLAEDVRRGEAQKPQFVIWPEDSSDVDPLVNPDAGQQISQAATAIGLPILVGTVLDVPDRPQQAPEFTNTVLVWNPVTGPADRHDKEIVQPFGEYLPMPWLFRHLSGYADRAGHIVPRPSTDVVQIAGVPVGVATCWEVIFDREPRKAVRNGAQLLAVPSNNATFNQTMSEQQLAFAKVRAVEHDRYVVVAGTTGISAVIAPDGGELARTEFFQPAHLDTQVRLKTRLTPATRWAPVLQWLLVGAAGAVILLAIRHNGWSPRPSRPNRPSQNRQRGDEDAFTDSDAADEDVPEPSDTASDAADDYTPQHMSGPPPRHTPRHKGAT